MIAGSEKFQVVFVLSVMLDLAGWTWDDMTPAMAV
jgi:hypothetical protein